MNSMVTQEFKNNNFNSVLQTSIGSTVVWEGPRLTTMYPRLGVPKGSDRAICRTVNGVLQAKVNDKSILFANNTGVTVTFALWGEYNKAKGVISSAKYYIDAKYGSNFLEVLSAFNRGGYGVPIFNSNGALGSYAFNSFSNHAQNIFMRATFVRELPQTTPVVPIPLDITFSGILLAADPG